MPVSQHICQEQHTPSLSRPHALLVIVLIVLTAQTNAFSSQNRSPQIISCCFSLFLFAACGRWKASSHITTASSFLGAGRCSCPDFSQHSSNSIHLCCTVSKRHHHHGPTLAAAIYHSTISSSSSLQLACSAAAGARLQTHSAVLRCRLLPLKQQQARSSTSRRQTTRARRALCS